MEKNFKKVAAGCASALIVLFSLACQEQSNQEAPKPATETSQAPTAPQTAPAEGAAPAPAEGTAPGQAAPAQPPPAQGQQAPNQQ